jgi:exosortase
MLNRLSNGLGPILIALAACWLLFFDELRGEWEINAQYNYGWLVPALGLTLLYLRWPGRPVPAPPEAGPIPARIAVALLALLLPIRLMYEANPEWRLLYWFHGFQVLGLSFCLLYRLGGWPWVRHFSPPLLFMLIAVPWPMEWETAAIQGLMRFVAGLTVGVAGWLGIPAVQHGNLIEVSVGVVGIDEACSGVRSLQSALMISLFLGEMYRFAPWRRLTLVVLSFGFVLAANLTRTTFLVWAAARHGMKQMEAWHDNAGTLVMVIVLAGLMVLAALLNPTTPRSPRVPANNPLKFPELSRWAGLATLGWLAAVMLLTEQWYRMHESRLVTNPVWRVEWPVQNASFQRTTVSDESLAILRCNHSEAGHWEDDDGVQWSAFFLRWDAGKNSAALAKGHRPDVCLPASGSRLADDFGRTNVAVADLKIPFTHQTFLADSRLLHVFYCLWPDRVSAGETTISTEDSRGGRVAAG